MLIVIILFFILKFFVVNSQKNLNEQCGGIGYSGSTVCVNSICFKKNNYYFQCLNSCPRGWECSSSSTATSASIIWQPDNWAFACDFSNNDLSDVQTTGANCGPTCVNNPLCSHFTWTTYNGGTCWLKTGNINKNDAIYTGDNTMVCGVLRSTIKNNSSITTSIFNSTSSSSTTSSSIIWQPGDWAFNCDFTNNDLSNVQTTSAECRQTCVNNPQCTHFTWTTYNNGTCLLKYGPISKTDALKINDNSMVCGIVRPTLSDSTIFSTTRTATEANNEINFEQQLPYVLTTRHGATEKGACELPDVVYNVINPVALGNVSSLGYLKFQPDLCGHILRINCGNGDLDVIITNFKFGVALKLYGSTWGIATNNLPPGIASCRVKLTSRNPIQTSTNPICYYIQSNNHRIALFNTGIRIVNGATLKGIKGTHRGSNPYYEFDTFATGSDQVIFSFDDGSTHTVKLSDCAIGINAKHNWN